MKSIVKFDSAYRPTIERVLTEKGIKFMVGRGRLICEASADDVRAALQFEVSHEGWLVE